MLSMFIFKEEANEIFYLCLANLKKNKSACQTFMILQSVLKSNIKSMQFFVLKKFKKIKIIRYK